MSKKQFILLYRIFFVLLVIAAIAAQLAYSLIHVQNFSIVNLFSFFTVQSNLFGTVTFLMSAYVLYKRKKRDPELDSLRGAATLYMVLTGLTYSLLLTHVEVQNSLAWSNAVLHYVFPLAMLFDWIYDRPDRKFAFKDFRLWFVYPLVYAGYTFIRAPFAQHWYPYPFVDVTRYGYGMVALNCVILALGIVVLAVIIARLPASKKLLKARRALRASGKN